MDRRQVRAHARRRSVGRTVRVAVAAALVAASLSASGGAGAACRTPAPYKPGDPRVVSPDGTTARGGGSWSRKPGAHAGAERPGGYVFADGSTDGVVIVAGASSGTTRASAHVYLGTDGSRDYCSDVTA